MSAAHNEQLTNVLSRLKKVTGRNGQYSALCPAHDDDQPSLRISVGRDDQVIMKCLRGDACSIEDIVRSIGLQMSDLFPKEQKRATKKLVDTYMYFDADGTKVMEVLRYQKSDGKKSFLQRRPDKNGGWNWSTQGIEKPLYRLPQVLRVAKEGGDVWVVEGEKDVHTLEHQGMVATCNPGGAGGPGQNKWMSHHTKSLVGANVTIITDNDIPGTVHAKSVKNDLESSGINVTVMAPPLPHKDVTDLIEGGGSISDLLVVDISKYLREDGAEVANVAQEADPDTVTEFLSNAAAVASRDDISPTRKAEMILMKAERLSLSMSEDYIGEEDTGKLVEWRPFLEEKVDLSYDWIIPGLLERQDRVIVVASEGAGKTTLARQMSMMCSAGLHPFKRVDIKPIRTLMVDLENPERIIRRTCGRIYSRVKSTGRVELMDGAHLLMKPDGINLLSRQDQDMLEEVVEATRPDIVFLGPIYKSFLDPGGRTAESVCTQLVRYFDKLRIRYDCAMWLEHHAPLGSGGHREMRPFGSAVWSRWSEFGIAIQPDPADPDLIQFNHYRGQREPREWPILCKRGKTWPFEVVEFADFDEQTFESDVPPLRVYEEILEHHDTEQRDLPF